MKKLLISVLLFAGVCHAQLAPTDMWLQMVAARYNDKRVTSVPGYKTNWYEYFIGRASWIVPLNEGTGTNLYDYSGSNRHGWVRQTPIWTNRPGAGSALQFNQASSTTAQFGAWAMCSGTSNILVSMWINCAPNGSDGYAGILDASHYVGGGWVIQQELNNHGTIRFSWWDGSAFAVYTNNFYFGSNQWNHLAFIKTGTQLYCYKNGQEFGGVRTVPAAFPNTVTTNWISGYFAGGGAYPDRNWAGMLSDIIIIPGGTTGDAVDVYNRSGTNWSE